MRHNAVGLLGVVEDLAFAAMMEMGKLTPLNPKPAHLPTSLLQAAETAFAVEERAGAHHVHFVVNVGNDVPEMVYADSTLHRVIYNLVSNALKVPAPSFLSLHSLSLPSLAP